jgi:putative DNA primase/helicase
MSEPAHIQLIRALDGDERTGMCRCPAHDDETPSLHVGAGDKVPVVLHCHAGCTYEQVAAVLCSMNLWPVHSNVAAPKAAPKRSAEERRHYALRILASTRRNYGRQQAFLLKEYFSRRGIKSVPATALLASPYKFASRECEILFLPSAPAMIFPVTDSRRTLGIHVTWLNGYLTDKREDEPQRQCFGPIRGGYIKLYRGGHSERLIIAEGVETACAAAQLTGLSAICALSAENMPLITPPPAAEYIICADNDANGVGQAAARALARRLVAAGAIVRIAVPRRPDTDWNDEVMP